MSINVGLSKISCLSVFPYYLMWSFFDFIFFSIILDQKFELVYFPCMILSSERRLILSDCPILLTLLPYDHFQTINF